MSVHLLHAGRALCGLPGVPRTWPDGHRWMSLVEHEKMQARAGGSRVDCESCLFVAFGCKLTCVGGSERGTCDCKSPKDCCMRTVADQVRSKIVETFRAAPLLSAVRDVVIEHERVFDQIKPFHEVVREVDEGLRELARSRADVPDAIVTKVEATTPNAPSEHGPQRSSVRMQVEFIVSEKEAGELIKRAENLLYAEITFR